MSRIMLKSSAPLALAALVACGTSSSSGPKPDTLRFAMKDASRQVGECRTSDSAKTPVPCVRVNLLWPEIADTGTGARAPKDFVERLVRSSFANGRDARSTDSVVSEIVTLHALMTRNHKQGYRVPWLAERKVTVACNEPGRFGIKVFSNQFMGGSHATSATRYANFDTRTGQPIGLADVIRPGKEAALKEAAMTAYAKRRDVGSVADVKLKPEEFPDARSALVCGDSLVLQYDVLALGPHRMIGSEISVSEDALKGIVR
jgi:hypothetical protein